MPVLSRLGDEAGVRIVDDVSFNVVARGDIGAGPVVRPDGALLRHGEVLAADEDASNAESRRRGASGRGLSDGSRQTAELRGRRRRCWWHCSR